MYAGLNYSHALQLLNTSDVSDLGLLSKYRNTVSLMPCLDVLSYELSDIVAALVCLVECVRLFHMPS